MELSSHLSLYFAEQVILENFVKFTKAPATKSLFKKSCRPRHWFHQIKISSPIHPKWFVEQISDFSTRNNNKIRKLKCNPEVYLEPSRTSTMELFDGDSQRFLSVNYFRKKAPSQLSDWVLNFYQMRSWNSVKRL